MVGAQKISKSLQTHMTEEKIYEKVCSPLQLCEYLIYVNTIIKTL